MKTYNPQNTAMKLRLLRQSAGYTPEDAAVKLNIPLPQLRRIEAGQEEVTLELVAAFSALYQVRTDFILLDQDDAATPEEAMLNELLFGSSGSQIR